MNDEVALLVRLAGTSGLIAAERVARVGTAVYGAWSDEYIARQVTRRRRLTVAVRFAAAASSRHRGGNLGSGPPAGTSTSRAHRSLHGQAG